MSIQDVLEKIEELLVEAKESPDWTAIQALRCLRKEIFEETTVP